MNVKRFYGNISHVTDIPQAENGDSDLFDENNAFVRVLAVETHIDDEKHLPKINCPIKI